MSHFQAMADHICESIRSERNAVSDTIKELKAQEEVRQFVKNHTRVAASREPVLPD